jgi:type II secretory pathway component PulF
MVRAGEEGGFLDRALSDVADYLDRDLQLRNLYKRITFYPKLQVGASIVIVIGANLIIASISSKAQQLSSPLTTPSTWFWLGPLIVILFLFLRVGLANPQIRYGWDTLLTNLPVFGKIMKELAMARFGRAFGAMYRSGVPMTRAMQISSDACGNEFLRARMYTAVKVLETGAGVTETLKSTQAFSPIVLDMVHTGETTGNLDQMLNKMSEFYEDEVQTKSTQLAYIVGVLLGLFVAIYIGYIVIGFYSGYFSGITNAVGE